MKALAPFKLVCIFLLGLGICFGQNPEKIKFASWNIRWQSQEDVEKGNAWSKRFEPIADVIRFFDFDIVAMQESSTNREQDLMPLLQDYDFLKTDTLEHNPILIKKGLFAVLDKGRFYLSETPQKKSKGWDAKHTRYCTWAKLKKDGTEFFVFNTHFDHKGKTAQAESAKLLHQVIPSIANSVPLVLAGDFNISTSANNYSILASIPGTVDASERADFFYEVKKSYNYFDPIKNSKWDFDHIFVSTNIHVYRYGVLNATYYDGDTIRYPSDHSPITITFQISH